MSSPACTRCYALTSGSVNVPCCGVAFHTMCANDYTQDHNGNGNTNSIYPSLNPEPYLLQEPYMADTESQNSVNDSNQPTRQSKSRPGPPFEGAKVVCHIMAGQNLQQLAPEIMASIWGTFSQVDNKWVCHRNNYFTVTCSFSLAIDGPFYLGSHQHLEQVTRFAISISAVDNDQESEVLSLVQFTPKRNKRSAKTPKPRVVLPTLPTSFERIQFEKATGGNQRKYFRVVVGLFGDIGRPEAPENWVMIATKKSFPMIVRGRPPCHYKKAQNLGGRYEEYQVSAVRDLQCSEG
jgi:NDT80 / PhoG like DNA-binding  family